MLERVAAEVTDAGSVSMPVVEMKMVMYGLGTLSVAANQSATSKLGRCAVNSGIMSSSRLKKNLLEVESPCVRSFQCLLKF